MSAKASKPGWEAKFFSAINRYESALSNFIDCAEQANRAAEAENEESEEKTQRRVNMIHEALDEQSSALAELSEVMKNAAPTDWERRVFVLRKCVALEAQAMAAAEATCVRLGAALNSLENTRDNLTGLSETYGAWDRLHE